MKLSKPTLPHKHTFLYIFLLDTKYRNRIALDKLFKPTLSLSLSLDHTNTLFYNVFYLIRTTDTDEAIFNRLQILSNISMPFGIRFQVRNYILLMISFIRFRIFIMQTWNILTKLKQCIFGSMVALLLLVTVYFTAIGHYLLFCYWSLYTLLLLVTAYSNIIGHSILYCYLSLFTLILLVTIIAAAIGHCLI